METSSELIQKSENLKDFLKDHVKTSVHFDHRFNDNGELSVVKLSVPNVPGAFTVASFSINDSNESILEKLKDDARRQGLIMSMSFK